MEGAAFALAMNIALAALFAATFAAVALTNPGRKGVLAFSASYGLGMLTPTSHLAIALAPWPEFWLAASYGSFVAGLVTMTAALARFYGHPVPWLLVGGVLLYTVATGFVLRTGTRLQLFYELAYQMPFALAAAASCWVVLRMGGGRPIDRVLAGLYGLLALHFPLKGVMVVMLGGGRRLEDYVVSTYALFSQAASSVLLVAIGLVTVLLVVQRVIADAQSAADTDSLSGLANRRGFEKQAQAMLARAARPGASMALIMLDLDHFKRINDTYGHAAGDQVIRRVAALLQLNLGGRHLAGRLGGEEFAVLLEDMGLEQARARTEMLRQEVAGMAGAGLPSVTLSAGVTGVWRGEDIAHAMRRADEALYQAKRSGRDRVCVALAPADADPADASSAGDSSTGDSWVGARP